MADGHSCTGLCKREGYPKVNRVKLGLWLCGKCQRAFREAQLVLCKRCPCCHGHTRHSCRHLKDSPTQRRRVEEAAMQ